MSHIQIHYSLEDLKDFILNVYYDALLLYPHEINDSIFIWCLSYIKLIKLNITQKTQLKKIAIDIHKYYNEQSKLHTFDEHNNIVLFAQHIWSLFLNRDINVELHLKEDDSIIPRLFKKSLPEKVDVNNIEVIHKMRRSEEIIVNKNENHIVEKSSFFKSESYDNSIKVSTVPEVLKIEKDQDIDDNKKNFVNDNIDEKVNDTVKIEEVVIDPEGVIEEKPKSKRKYKGIPK